MYAVDLTLGIPRISTDRFLPFYDTVDATQAPTRVHHMALGGNQDHWRENIEMNNNITGNYGPKACVPR